MTKDKYVESLMRWHRVSNTYTNANLWSEWAYTIAFFCYHSGMDLEEAKCRIKIVSDKRTHQQGT